MCLLEIPSSLFSLLHLLYNRGNVLICMWRPSVPCIAVVLLPSIWTHCIFSTECIRRRGKKERKKDKNLHGQLDTTSKGSFANYKPFFAFSPKKRIEKGGTDHLLLEDQISTKFMENVPSINSWNIDFHRICGKLFSIVV